MCSTVRWEQRCYPAFCTGPSTQGLPLSSYERAQRSVRLIRLRSSLTQIASTHTAHTRSHTPTVSHSTGVTYLVLLRAQDLFFVAPH